MSTPTWKISWGIASANPYVLYPIKKPLSLKRLLIPGKNKDMKY